VQQVRRALGIKKVGHSGTLDPFASGLLIICAGRPATKIISQLMAGEKEYAALLKLGTATDTQDLEGKIIAQNPVPEFSDDEIRACLAGFVGEQLQTPPAFSALKHKGKPLYHYARKGIVVEKEPRLVVIKKIDLLSRTADEISIRVRCGKGVYIRTLAADIGQTLGCGAHLQALRRTVNGPFRVEDAVDGDDLQDKERGREILLGSLHTVEEILAVLVEKS
jgi:tRNA pseudouridine55 synthase